MLELWRDGLGGATEIDGGGREFFRTAVSPVISVLHPAGTSPDVSRHSAPAEFAAFGLAHAMPTYVIYQIEASEITSSRCPRTARL
jgi:hypothetical protein